MSDSIQGSAANPVKLNDHFFGPIITEVHWSTDLLVAMKVVGLEPEVFTTTATDKTPVPTNAGSADDVVLGVIDPTQYIPYSLYYPNYRVISGTFLALYLDSYVTSGDTSTTERYSQFFDLVTVSAIFNLKNCVGGQALLPGRTGDEYEPTSFDDPTPRLYLQTVPFNNTTVEFTAYSPNTQFTLLADGTISAATLTKNKDGSTTSAPAIPTWSFTATLPWNTGAPWYPGSPQPPAGPNSVVTFDKNGMVV